MRFRLRTLLIVLAVIPPVLAGAYLVFASLGPWKPIGWIAVFIALAGVVGAALARMVDSLDGRNTRSRR